MKSVALYARVSSEQQAQQATVESQIAALKQRAEADGHLVLPHDIYVDDGFSGATLVRPALERLRDRVAESGLDVLYVHSPDRLARRYAYQVLLLDELKNHGAQVVFLLGPSGQSAEDELLVQVQGMIAEYERAKILERSRRGKLHRARQGLINPLAAAPYGYLYVRKTDGMPAAYQVLLHEAKVVRRIYDSLVGDQKSIGQIARELNAEGIATRRGAPRWDRTTVWAILRNPAYMGKAAYGKTEATTRGQLLRPTRSKASAPRRAKSTYRDKSPEQWIHVDVPPIISADVFAAAREQLERNKRLSERNGRGKRYLLQGLTVCAACGYAFYGKLVSRATAKHKPRRHAYYRCIGADSYRFAGGRVCHNPPVRVDQLDGYVWDSVCELLQDPERMMGEWSKRAGNHGIHHELSEQREHAARLLAAQEASLQRLVDAYEAGVLPLSELTARSERVRTRVAHARKALEEADSNLSRTIEMRAVVTRLEAFGERVRAGLANLAWLERRQLIRTLVARVEIQPDGATIVYRIPSTGTSGPSGSEAPEDSNAPTTAEPVGAIGMPLDSQSCQLRGRRICENLGRRWARESGGSSVGRGQSSGSRAGLNRTSHRWPSGSAK
jgi:site-specific DNA recombinase